MNLFNLTNAEKKALEIGEAFVDEHADFRDKIINGEASYGDMFDSCRGFVDKIRGKAMVKCYASSIEALSIILRAKSRIVGDAVCTIVNAPYGSITRTMEDIDYADDLANLLYHLAAADIYMNKLETKALDKTQEAMGNDE